MKTFKVTVKTPRDTFVAIVSAMSTADAESMARDEFEDAVGISVLPC